MRRREFITLIGGAAGAWPVVARGQQPDAQQHDRVYRVGFLLPAGRQTPAALAMFDELRVNGFADGKNLVVIPGGFEAADQNLAELTAALVQASPDAIVAGPERPLRELQERTRTIPLIGMTEDMVAEGMVTSLARPGGNITGISLLSLELDGKRQDVLIEMVPGARRIAAMADARVTPSYHLETLKHGARSRGVDLLTSSAIPMRSHLLSMQRKRLGPRRSIFWPRPCFRSPIRATTALSWNASRQYGFRQFSNGPKPPKRAGSQATARALLRRGVSGRA
jgi:putative tryptophan/tyrosine transport system substrate-binding protein